MNFMACTEVSLPFCVAPELELSVLAQAIMASVMVLSTKSNATSFFIILFLLLHEKWTFSASLISIQLHSMSSIVLVFISSIQRPDELAL